MNSYVKMAIAVAMMMVVGGFVVLRHGGASHCCPGHPGGVMHGNWDDGGEEKEPKPTLQSNWDDDKDKKEPKPTGLPQLVELGSTTCVPCQMMKPVIEEITAEYKGKLEVVFVDVQKDLDTAQRFNIRVIPTQVFLDASGQELYRNEGVLSKEDILTKWAELGFTFESDDVI